MIRPLRRPVLLLLAALVAGGANDYGLDDAWGTSRFEPAGAFGAYLTGRFAAQETDLGVAADKLEAALSQDPGVPAVATQAFIAAVMAGRPAAIRLAAPLTDNPVAQLVLAGRDAHAGAWPLAEARFQALPAQGLTQVLRPLLIAWAQQGAGRTDAALATLQPGLDGRYRGVMALHAALIADLAGRTEDATRLYQAARRDYGALNLRLGAILASWQARQGGLDEAQATVRELVAGSGDLGLARTALEATVASPAVRNPLDGIAEAYLAMAASLRQQDGAESAHVLLRLALDLRPDFTAARLLLADIQENARQARLALDTLAGVATDDPLAPVIQLRRAGLMDQLGETDEAARLLEQLAAEHPDRPEPLVLAADMLRRKSRFPEAVEMYSRAAARIGTPSRGNWPLFYARGIAYERAGQWDKAEEDFRFALRLAPDQPSVLNYLGYSWTEQGRNLPQARSMIERAVEQRPNDGAFLDSLGWVLLRLGDAPGALRNLERATELQPEDPVINGHLGDALQAVGRAREAEFQWRRALNLRPEPPEAQRISAKLQELAAPAAAPAQP